MHIMKVNINLNLIVTKTHIILKMQHFKSNIKGEKSCKLVELLRIRIYHEIH